MMDMFLLSFCWSPASVDGFVDFLITDCIRISQALSLRNGVLLPIILQMIQLMVIM